MDGYINLLKPPGMTSSDAVVKLRKALPRGTKVGHAGTLDPEAAGVLPLCVGKATRLFDYLIDKKKQYIAEISFGTMTDTQDATGKVIEKCDKQISANQLIDALPEFQGEISQIPPAYSAIKQNGMKLYELARKGITVDVPARSAQVYEIEWLEQTGTNTHLLRIPCGKGTYIRTICHDIGLYLGTVAHMKFLIRSSAGAFHLDNAITLEQLLEASDIQSLLIPMDMPLATIPAVMLPSALFSACINGNPIHMKTVVNLPDSDVMRIYCGDAFAGIASRKGDYLAFKAMLLDKVEDK